MIKALEMLWKFAVRQLIENHPASLGSAGIAPAWCSTATRRIAARSTPPGGVPREVCLPQEVRPLAFLKARGGVA